MRWKSFLYNDINFSSYKCSFQIEFIIKYLQI